MQRPPRGAWSGFDQMKPASEYDIRYGHHLVRSTSSQWPSYVVVSSPTAYRMTEPHLTRRPETVGYPAKMDFGYLKQFTGGLPDNVNLVVGIGGGLGTGREQVRRAYKAASSRADTDNRFDGSDHPQRLRGVGGPQPRRHQELAVDRPGVRACGL